MKKVYMMVCAALVALASCEKQPVESPVNASPEIVFNLSATHPGDTKAVKTDWETGDKIFVFIEGQTAPAYLELKWSGSTWENNPKGLSSIADGTVSMRAVYLPFGSGATVSADGVGNYVFSETYNTYYLTDQQSFPVSGGVVTGTFNMQIPEGYEQFFLDDTSASTATEIELREPHLTPQGISFIAPDGAITHTTVAHGAPLKGYVYDKEVKGEGESRGWLFSGILASGARNTSTDYHFTLVSGAWDSGSYYSQAFTSKTLYTGAAAGRAVKLPALTGWTEITDYKPIDLGCDVTVDGVTKRIYWASRNLGASSDFPAANTDDARHATWGDYYAWGETEPYYIDGQAQYNSPSWKSGKEDGYDWSSYRYGSDPYALTKYFSDGLTELVVSDNPLVNDDAANAVAAGIWRMPTNAEWTALSNTTNYLWNWDNSNKGQVVKSNIGGFEERFIFLPAADTRVYTGFGGSGSYGNYWSSTLDSVRAYRACSFGFTSGGISLSADDRCGGLSIRPVSD